MTRAKPWAICLHWYLLTTGAAVAVSIGIRLVLSSAGPFGASSCVILGKAIPILLFVIGGEFLVSIGIFVSLIIHAGLVAWERLIPLAYGLVLVATYVALALGVRAAFRC